MISCYNDGMAFGNRINQPFPSEVAVSPRRRLRWLEVLLVIAFIFCLLVGLGALSIFWRLYFVAEPVMQTDNPVLSLQPESILPQLALRQLAGDPAEALAAQAFYAGELETSRAILTFRAELPDAARLGLLLQLARHYAEAEQPQIAALLYRQARTVAMLAPTLSSFERSQALIQCSEGFLALNENAAALDSAEQAKRIGQQAPDLLPAQRSQLFNSLRPLADRFADTAFYQQIVELARNPFLAPPGKLILLQLAQRVEPVTFDAALSTAIATRQQRARELADRIAFTNGIDFDPERETLAQALLAEDQARSAFSGQMQAAGLSSSQQLWLALDYREWLLLKLRIAAGGFGLSLVPAWEANRAALTRELTARTNNLDTLFEALAGAESEAIDQAGLRFAARSWLAYQLELGLSPGASAVDLDRRLREAAAALAQADSPLALPIAYEPDASPPGFRIQPVQ
jgi:hypothetical protein